MARTTWMGLTAAVILLAACSRTPEPAPAAPSAPPVAQQPTPNVPVQPQPPLRAPLPPMAGAETPAPATQLKQMETVPVALLAPLSGEHAALGQSLLDAASLALFDKYATLTRPEQIREVILKPYDTKGTRAGAEAAIKEAVADNAQIVLGPLFAEEVSAIRLAARRADLPVISFSNQRDVAGDGVFTFGFSPEAQVQRLAGHTSQNGIFTYSAIVPRTPYAMAVTDYFSKATQSRNQELYPLELYDGSPETAIERVTQAVIGRGAVRQGLFLPMEGGDLATVAAAIRGHKKIQQPYVKFLGTGSWDDPAIWRIPAVQGAWYASTDPAPFNRFATNFTQNYGYAPARVAGLAYDAMALAAALGLQPQGVDYSFATLAEPQGYIGPVNGIFRLKSDGSTERGLALLEISGGKAVVIDAAPSSF